ncbi:hypothetical protein KP509_29G065200 [Ceratopteris richardii]|uniref:Beta-galactosidase n=1 Tax=Ceratopteris richardii TaxID=49495 RepID=A0A8T2R9E8_CERRI|nr:hypothetical protein KP509_29G065200 [Ceratopteris richardii]
MVESWLFMCCLHSPCFRLLDKKTNNSRQGNKKKERSFLISDDMFWKDGEPFRILGGDVHYFRIHPKYWEDRLLRAKALALNTIQTYVPWNLHEPRKGKYHFDGIADLESFLKLAQKLGFLVMVRAGPYICAEWDFGGFPAWLLMHQPALRLRSSDPLYLALVDDWWKILLPKINSLLYENGGPVIMVQVENEFGSFGEDKEYLEHLVNQARLHLGNNIIIYTTDGASEINLENGSLKRPDVYTAVDFSIDEDAAKAFALQKKFNAKGKSPSLISEFYTGWLTHWRESIATTSSDKTAAALEKILTLNASAVLYMAHGGTNFGFFSGANSGDNSSDYKPDITSYDYDAPISEAGDVGHSKFTALQRVLARYNTFSFSSPPPLPLRVAYGNLHLGKLTTFFDALQYIAVPPGGVAMQEPCTMESLNQITGFLLYETLLPAHSKPGSLLSIPKVHDRGQVFIWTRDALNNSRPYHIGTMERWSTRSLYLPDSAPSGSKLQILVENMGRLNYGPFLYDPKGILSSVFLDGVPLKEWKAFSIPMDDLSPLHSFSWMYTYKISTRVTNETRNCLESMDIQICDSDIDSMNMGFYYAVLQIDESQEPGDSFLSMKGWSKGLVFINNFNLGRYWMAAGPQCTLYIPGPLLQQGENILLIFELESPHPNQTVEFMDAPDFTC